MVHMDLSQLSRKLKVSECAGKNEQVSISNPF